jgi:hypothetical protein
MILLPIDLRSGPHAILAGAWMLSRSCRLICLTSHRLRKTESGLSNKFNGVSYWAQSADKRQAREAALDIPQQLVPHPSRGSGHNMPQSAAGEQSKGAVHQHISKKVAPLTGLTVTSANSFCIIRCTSASVSGSIEEVASSRIRIRLRLVSARISATARQTLV